jgi:hypothetical protein
MPGGMHIIPSGIGLGIEFKHRGRLWRADTVEEAIALRRKLEMADEVAFEAGEELPFAYAEQIWTHDTVNDLLGNAGYLQKKFLRAVAEGKSTSDELVAKLNLNSEVALAGVLSGLSKQLKKLGVKTSDLYSVDVSWTGKNKTRTFSLVNDFRWVAAELGWPEKWDQK